MKATRLLSLFSLFLMLAFPLPRLSFAQDVTVAQLENQLVSAWLVTVAGEDRTRTLRITGAKPNGNGAYQLDAVYGWTDGQQTPVHAEVVATAEGRTLRVTTQPGSRIATKQNPDGTFVGTFTPVNGPSKTITLERASEDVLAKAKQPRAPTINQPAADVPAACAAFVGGWIVKWDGYSERWLWVTEIDAKCVAKYSWGPKKPSSLKSTEIKNGSLAFACGTPGNGGICTFTNHGDVLWGSYAGSDGTNQGVFKKVTTEN